MKRSSAQPDVRDPNGALTNINSEMRHLWRAVGYDCEVQESYTLSTRDKAFDSIPEVTRLIASMYIGQDRQPKSHDEISAV